MKLINIIKGKLKLVIRVKLFNSSLDFVISHLFIIENLINMLIVMCI